MKNKSQIVVIIILLGINIYQYFIYQNLFYKNSELNELKKGYHLSDTLAHSIEGKNLWNVFSITENNYQLFLESNNIEKEIFFITIIDSITCMKCYDFHVKYWVKLSSEIPMFCYSKNLFNLVKKDVSTIKPFLDDPQLNIKIGQNRINFLNVLVNKNGKILYADFAFLKNLDRSKIFYNIVCAYMSIKY